MTNFITNLDIITETEKQVINSAKPTAALVSADYYQDITAELVKGAEDYLKHLGISCRVYYLSGALELPSAIALLKKKHDIFIAIGAVIRGETSHYDIVAQESTHAIMQLSWQEQLPIGNSILTVNNLEQAKVRADVKGVNKGGFAAQAALRLWLLKQELLLK